VKLWLSELIIDFFNPPREKREFNLALNSRIDAPIPDYYVQKLIES